MKTKFYIQLTVEVETEECDPEDIVKHIFKGYKYQSMISELRTQKCVIERLYGNEED